MGAVPSRLARTRITRGVPASSEGSGRGGTTEATLAEICIVALAEAFRGDGEVLCNPMGPVPVIAGRLARATFEPDLMLTDTIA